jgi:hypothetical protein
MFVFKRALSLVKFAELGQECNVEEECILSGGNMADIQCITGKCECIVDHIPDVENNKCNSGEFAAVFQEYYLII